MTNGHGKSDSLVVPAKPSNKDGTTAAPPAERAEERKLAKGNSKEQTRTRTQIRLDLQRALDRVREAAVRDRELRFTNLWFHVYDIDRLREAYFGLKRDAAPGVDRVTWRSYGEALEENLFDLADRLKRGAYRAKPVKRVYIPKPDGRQRPLGVTALEDKIVQRATVEVLNAVYEVDFLGFSYGFRPGRNPHMALDALAVAIQTRPVNFVLDADIRGFFDAIDHDCLMGLVERRVADVRVLRHIKKWLNAGVMEQGRKTESKVGSPQGSSISPMLANIYLHYVLDQWAHEWRRERVRATAIIVRWADDFIDGFEHREEAEQFLVELRERLAEFHLELHPDKTRIIAFGRKADDDWRSGKGPKPGTFDFLGFTHACGRTRKGNRFIVLRQTARQRLGRKLKAMKLWIKEHLHDPVPMVGAYLRKVIMGHVQYFGVPRNGPSLRAFIKGLAWLWYKSLRRRSQKTRMTWKRMYRLLRAHFPPPRIVHPYPEQRFAVMTRGKSPVR
jgi:group II intron reverse transcriptase/maturase